MPTIKEEAQNFVAPELKTIADLPSVDIMEEVLSEKEAQFPYKYIQREGTRYKFPNSVFNDLQAQLIERPDIKRFKVKKQGEGIKTKYTLIVLE